jgi:hypothetical protein
MSWFHASTTHWIARNHASPAEIVACFQAHRGPLGKLAFLITGDQTAADRAIGSACEITLQGNGPFRAWLIEWAKVATIMCAISLQDDAIRICEPMYKDRSCSHIEHLCELDDERRAAGLALILKADDQQFVAELDPLCRAILVLRLAIRSSIQDCVFRLNVSLAAVLAANCHAMNWLDQCHMTLRRRKSHDDRTR